MTVGTVTFRAVHVDAATGRSVIVVGKRRVGRIILRDEPEIGGETRLLGGDLAATCDLLCS